MSGLLRSHAWRALGVALILPALVGCPAKQDEKKPETRNPMDTVYTVDSTKSIEQVGADLVEAAKNHKFGVLGHHDLRAKMKEKGVEFPNDCLVYEVCNPHKASQVLTADMRISTALPCRISIYKEGEKTRLATIRPKLMLEMFGASAVEGVAAEVEQTLLAIMDEAARS